MPWSRRLKWTALASVPSRLLLAVTTYLSTDIAAVPLLWVAPLSIYLLTFVVAFGSRSSSWNRIAARRLPLLVTALVMFMAGGVGGPLWLVIPLHLLTFAFAALACHGRLAEDRPPAGLLTVLTLTIGEADGAERLVVPGLGIPVILAFSQSRRPLRFALSLAAMLAAAALMRDSYGHVLHTERTFFGTYRVTLDAASGTRSLFHGTTLHGVEAYEGPDRGEPLTYYSRGGPFGQAFSAVPAMSSAKEVAVIGLGVGSLASYAGAAQRWTFFEIDPAVERIARTRQYFTHLSDCGERCRVVLGDARLSLAREAGAQYGLLVLDAFSSDAIPVHLITREAIVLYVSRLTADGVLAFHVSNRHLALGPVMARLAADAGLAAVEQQHSVTRQDVRRGRRGSHWVIMAKSPGTLDALRRDSRWVQLGPKPRSSVWTDDFSNILSVLQR